jgi:MprA protease rhombosortase-interaction domain-containing protein
LLLLISPGLLAYSVLAGALTLRAEGCWRPVVGGGALLFAGLLAYQLRRCVIVVPPGQAVIVVERNRQSLGAWLPGYHLALPGFFTPLGQAVTWPSHQERTLSHVACLGGPCLTLHLTFTATHLIPPYTATLPRKHIIAPVAERDQQIIRHLYLAGCQAAVWERIATNAIDQALRTFFSRVPLAQIYDPAGVALLPMDVLLDQLNRHLAATVEPGLRYRVQVHTLEVLAGDQREALVWRQQARQLQELVALTAGWTPEQVLLAGELLRDLQQDRSIARVRLDPASVFWAGAGQAGRGDAVAPRRGLYSAVAPPSAHPAPSGPPTV